MSNSTYPPWPSRPALFLDLDGTLLEIAAHPERAVPSGRLRALLPRLEPATGGAVALVSGRSIAELDRLLAPYRFAAAGVHGLERRTADGRDLTFESGDLLAGLRASFAAFVASHEGLLLEDKAFALALHYRLRPDLEPEVRRFVSDADASLPRGLELLEGKMVFEIKPDGANKGSAIREFMTEPPFAGRVPVFIGDDVTDEAGFAIVNQHGGVAVKVGTGETATAAPWRLDDVGAVLGWLELVVDAAREPAGAEG